MPSSTKPTGHPGRQTRHGYVSTEFETPEAPDYVIAELRYESPVAFTTSRFARPQRRNRKPQRLIASLPNTISLRFALSSERKYQKCASALKLPVLCLWLRGQLRLPTGDWTPISSKAVSFKSCQKEAATPKRSRANSSSKKLFGRRMLRRGLCRQCRQAPLRVHETSSLRKDIFTRPQMELAPQKSGISKARTDKA